jgi:hypothetical protein
MSGLGFARGVVMVYTVLPLACLIILATITFTVSLEQNLMGANLWAIFSAFLTICALGAIATIRPTVCITIIGGSRDGTNELVVPGTALGPTYAGHHPMSQEFSSHIFRLNGRILCAGCTGLFIGVVVSTFGSLLVFIGSLVGLVWGPLAFWLGFACMALPILRYPFYRPEHATTRLILGFSFVFGGFLLLVGVCSVSGNFSIAVFTLVVIIFMIYSRIMLSQAAHKIIVANKKNANG